MSGRFAIGTIGLGIETVSGFRRVPNPPAMTTAVHGVLIGDFMVSDQAAVIPVIATPRTGQRTAE